MKGKKIKIDTPLEGIIGKIFSWKYGEMIRRGVFVKACYKKDASPRILYLDNTSGSTKVEYFIVDNIPEEFKNNKECYDVTGMKIVSDRIRADGFIYLESDSYIPFL